MVTNNIFIFANFLLIYLRMCNDCTLHHVFTCVHPVHLGFIFLMVIIMVHFGSRFDIILDAIKRKK